MRMTERTWETDELRVLDALVAEDLAGRTPIDPRELAVASGIAEFGLEVTGEAWHPVLDVLVRIVSGLKDAGYVKAELWVTGWNAGPMPVRWGGITPTPEARRVVGQWPARDEVADRFITALEKAIETGGESTSDLVAMRDSAVRLGRDFLVSLLAGVAYGATRG